jgi:hypothetical protein
MELVVGGVTDGENAGFSVEAVTTVLVSPLAGRLMAGRCCNSAHMTIPPTTTASKEPTHHR